MRFVYRRCNPFYLINSSWVCRQWRTFSSEEVQQIGFTMSKLTPIDSSNSSPLIEKYSTKGFTISGNKVYGSVALLPKAYFHWKITKSSEITPESFTLFHIVKPKLVSHISKYFFGGVGNPPPQIRKEKFSTAANKNGKELVVLGTGAKIIPVHRDVTDYLKSKGIALEVQDTRNACAAFHYLMDEGRLAGAALIPPEYL